MMKRFSNEIEDEESLLPKSLRNLSITTTDDELTGNKTAREDEEL
jgi:hypothetical protein